MKARCGECNATFVLGRAALGAVIEAVCPICGATNRYPESSATPTFDRPSELIRDEAPLGRPDPNDSNPLPKPIVPPASKSHTIELPDIQPEIITDSDSQELPDPPPVSVDPPYEPPPKDRPILHLRRRTTRVGKTPPPSDTFTSQQTLHDDPPPPDAGSDPLWFDPDEPYPPPPSEPQEETPPSELQPEEAPTDDAKRYEEGPSDLKLELDPIFEKRPDAPEEAMHPALDSEDETPTTQEAEPEPPSPVFVPWRPYCFWGALGGAVAGFLFGAIEIGLAASHTIPGKPALGLIGEIGFFASVGWLMGLARSRVPNAWEHYPGMILAGAIAAGMAAGLCLLSWAAHIGENPDILNSCAGIVFRRALMALAASAPLLFLYQRRRALSGEPGLGANVWPAAAMTLMSVAGLGLELAVIEARISNDRVSGGASGRIAFLPAFLFKPEERPEPTVTTPHVTVIASEVAAPLEKHPEDLVLRFKAQNRSGHKTFWAIKASVFDKEGQRLAWRLIVNGAMKWTESDLDEISRRREAYIPPPTGRLRNGEIRRASFTFFGLRPHYHHYVLEAMDYESYLRVKGESERRK